MGKAVAANERRYGSERTEVASSTEYMGTALERRGDAAGALPLYQRSPAIRGRHMGVSEIIPAISEYERVASECSRTPIAKDDAIRYLEWTIPGGGK